MVDLQENMETLLLKAEEYLLIAKLAADKVIEQRYGEIWRRNFATELRKQSELGRPAAFNRAAP